MRLDLINKKMKVVRHEAKSVEFQLLIKGFLDAIPFVWKEVVKFICSLRERGEVNLQ